MYDTQFSTPYDSQVQLVPKAKQNTLINQSVNLGRMRTNEETKFMVGGQTFFVGQRSPCNKKGLMQSTPGAEEQTPTPSTLHQTETPKIHKMVKSNDLSQSLHTNSKVGYCMREIPPVQPLPKKIPVVKLENIQFNQNYRKP